jgi:transposase
MGSRRRFTKEFKQTAIQQLDSSSPDEICREHNIHQNMLHRWKKEYETNPGEAFKGNGKVWKESAKIAQYERLIGQLYAEIDLLKKRAEYLKQQRAEEIRARGHLK